MRIHKFASCLYTFTLLSCGSFNGPVMCINKYDSFSSASTAFSKCDNKNLYVDISKIELLKNHQTSYYLTGLCSHRPIHHEFEDLCDDLKIDDARIYSVSSEYCVNYNVYANATVSNNSYSIKPYDSSYRDKLSYYFNSFRKKYDYNPTECADFNYLSITEDEEIGKQCFLILSEDNLVGNIIYSADASLDTIESINNEILPLLQKNTD